MAKRKEKPIEVVSTKFSRDLGNIVLRLADMDPVKLRLHIQMLLNNENWPSEITDAQNSEIKREVLKLLYHKVVLQITMGVFEPTRTASNLKSIMDLINLVKDSSDSKKSDEISTTIEHQVIASYQQITEQFSQFANHVFSSNEKVPVAHESLVQITEIAAAYISIAHMLGVLVPGASSETFDEIIDFFINSLHKMIEKSGILIDVDFPTSLESNQLAKNIWGSIDPTQLVVVIKAILDEHLRGRGTYVTFLRDIEGKPLYLKEFAFDQFVAVILRSSGDKVEPGDQPQDQELNSDELIYRVIQDLGLLLKIALKGVNNIHNHTAYLKNLVAMDHWLANRANETQNELQRVALSSYWETNLIDVDSEEYVFQNQKLSQLAAQVKSKMKQKLLPPFDLL